MTVQPTHFTHFRLNLINGFSLLIIIYIILLLSSTCFVLLFKGQYDVIYLNSFFSPTSLIFYLLSFLGLIKPSKILVAPRGELTDGAFAIKSFKKRFFLSLFQLFVPYQQYSWHVSNSFEQQQLHFFLPLSSSKIFPAVDPVTLPSLSSFHTQDTKNTFRIVFASRISPKKNLHYLIESLVHTVSSCELVIYGCIDDPLYWKSCLALLNSLPTNVVWHYFGDYSPSDLIKVFGESDLFVFPTLSENFGHVIFESLSYGCPVLISPHTPWLSSPSSIYVLELYDI